MERKILKEEQHTLFALGIMRVLIQPFCFFREAMLPH
jgi:hypothetical protein